MSIHSDTIRAMAFAISVATLTVACGGGNKTPTAPTTPPPVTTTPPPPSVTPPYSGVWSGSYIIEQCSGTGSIQDLLCSAPAGGRPGGVYPVGSSLPITMELSQSGSTVIGIVSFGSTRGGMAGVVGANGLLALQGTATGALGGLTVTITITYWDTRASGSAMDGFINYDARASTLPGVAAVRTRLGTVRRQ